VHDGYAQTPSFFRFPAAFLAAVGVFSEGERVLDWMPFALSCVLSSLSSLQVSLILAGLDVESTSSVSSEHPACSTGGLLAGCADVVGAVRSETADPAETSGLTNFLWEVWALVAISFLFDFFGDVFFTGRGTVTAAAGSVSREERGVSPLATFFLQMWVLAGGAAADAASLEATIGLSLALSFLAVRASAGSSGFDVFSAICGGSGDATALEQSRLLARVNFFLEVRAPTSRSSGVVFFNWIDVFFSSPARLGVAEVGCFVSSVSSADS
jgi:hypothetical protein